MSEDQYGPVQSAGIARLVRGWDNPKDVHMTGLISAIVSSVVARAQRRDDQWFAIASDELLIPGSVLRDYAARGDSLSLTIFIHIIRRQFNNFFKPSWPRIEFSRVLETAPRFDVQDTTPELQHEFCALWNQIVLKAQNDDDEAIALYIIRRIRDVYVALHQGTDSAPTRFSASTRNWEPMLRHPSSYPVCNVAGHIHDNSASTTFSRTATLVPASLSSPDAPSSLVPSLHHIDESLTDVPSLDNSYPVHQTTIESLRIPVTSSDLATAGAIRNIVTSSTTTPLATPETSTSAPLSSIPPPAPIPIRHNTDLLTPSDTPNFPRSASNPVLNTTESHRSIIDTTAPIDSPRPTFTSDLATGSRKGKDAFNPASVNCATRTNTMTPDLPPQSPLLPLDTDSDVAVALSPRTERTGDHSLHPSHCRYDIV
ncbi:hypothetical protein EDB92DRAFT_1880910 [Lactarius akahatsu]|uniref:Uncharacterized protein n=1 Tax=Lactarius akahatsu TaxID=416441 RepID=A0AAD4Q874_9AGAM|nr:hypothetical protein EDB92DRAFT_1880910 [Lactarius akahatsu]